MEIKYLIALIALLVISIYINAQVTIDYPIIIDMNEAYPHNYGMSFCADNNWLVFSPSTGQYKEAIGTTVMFPRCVYYATEPVCNLPPARVIDDPKVTSYPCIQNGTQTQQVWHVNLNCLQAQCKRIVNVDFNTGHAILLWQNLSASLSP